MAASTSEIAFEAILGREKPICGWGTWVNLSFDVDVNFP